MPDQTKPLLTFPCRFPIKVMGEQATDSTGERSADVMGKQSAGAAREQGSDAIGERSTDVAYDTDLETFVRTTLEQHLKTPEALEIKSRVSRHKNYTSVTATFTAHSEEELKNLYQLISAHPKVKIVL